jgi:hypothetical protein
MELKNSASPAPLRLWALLERGQRGPKKKSSIELGIIRPLLGLIQKRATFRPYIIYIH